MAESECLPNKIRHRLVIAALKRRGLIYLEGKWRTIHRSEGPQGWTELQVFKPKEPPHE